MPTTAPPTITTRGLRKAFGSKVVLDGLDLDIPAGSIFALLGPNGAGKTTTVNILSTLVGADGGTVRVAGHDPSRDPDAVRASIGVTGQFAAVDGLLTGEENLALIADLHHLDRAEGRRRVRELRERFDLDPGGHIRLSFPDPTSLDAAADALAGSARDDAALALHVPGDGSARAIRGLLDRLDQLGLEVDQLSVHTPDLDDVFLALTG